MNLIVALLLITCLSAALSFQNKTYQSKQKDIIPNIYTDTTVRKVDLGKSNLTISIPRNYKFTKNQGTDYWWFTFKPKNTLDTVSPTGGIYLGNFPNKHLYPNDCPVIKQKMLFLGRLENLNIKRCTFHYYTQIIIQNTDTTAWYEKIQLFGEARSDKDLQQLILIMKSISRRSKPVAN